MISENIHDSLIESLKESSMEIISIFKALGNEYRFKIKWLKIKIQTP